MRRPLYVLLVASIGCFASLAPLASAQSGGSDPSADYLKGYLSVQQAEKLEREGSYKAALSKYRFAGSLFDQIHLRHPEWQPAIVDYRKKKTMAAIQNIEGKLALEAPPQPVAPIPQLDDPGQLDAPPLTADASPGDMIEQWAQRIRSQMSLLQQQLQQTQERLAQTERDRLEMARQLESATQRIRQGGGSGEDHSELAAQLAAAQTNEARLKTEVERLRASTESLAQMPERNAGNERLWAELEKARAEAAQNRTQAERAQASEADLMLRLADAEEQLKKANQHAEQVIRNQIAKIQDALDDARADREIAEEQGAIIARRMTRLANRPDLADQLAETERKANAIAAENEKLTRAAREADEKLAGLMKQLDQTQQEKTDLDTRLTQADEKIAKLEAAEKELIAMTQERDAAAEKNAKLTADLEARTKEAQKLAEERDRAVTALEAANVDTKEVARLLSENRGLVEKLEASEAALGKAEAATPEQKKEIASLKDSLASLEEKLTAAQKESEARKGLVDDLKAQLAATEATAAEASKEGAADGETARLAEENELLRGIVLRRLNEQTQREAAKKKIYDELARLQVRSRAINDQVEQLTQVPSQLSERERALFKTPQLEIIDSEADTMIFSIAAPQIDEAKGEGENGLKIGGETPLPKVPPAPGKASDVKKKAVEQEAALSPSAALWDTRPVVETGSPTPNVPEAFRDLAREARENFDRGRFLEAEKGYEALVKKLPGNVYALSNLGMARYRSGKLKLAEDTFKKVLALSPDDAYSYASLGIVYHDQSKYDDAINALTRSIAVNPRNPTAHNFLGVTAAKKGWIEAARKEIQTAIDIDPTYADAHFNLAVVLATAKPVDKESARRHYHKAVELGVHPDPNLEELIR
ncbi:MAG TPA: tetratricopeptide repeat protein [Chthoniobacteraceae bacterium]|nr:tetratricopeptide repeat protein [Chthoniobacteraceae bacterium]